MIKLKAPIYEEKGTIGNPELLKQLISVVTELEENMKASIPINRNFLRGDRIVGYGISKAQRRIAADRVISIAKEIKALKGW